MKAEHIKNGALALLAAAEGCWPKRWEAGIRHCRADFLHGGGLPHRYAGSGGVPALRQDGEAARLDSGRVSRAVQKAGELAAVADGRRLDLLLGSDGPGPR